MDLPASVMEARRYTTQEVWAELLSDHDIKKFLSDNEDLITDEMLQTSFGVLNEFVRSKNDPTVEAELIFYNKNIAITYKQIQSSELLKYRDRVPSKIFYDRQTERFKQAKLSEYEVNMDNQNAVGFVQNFIDVYQYGDRSKGLWLFGKFGRGKTYLMGCFANELFKRKVGVNFISVAQLMNDLYEKRLMNSTDDSVQKQIGYLQKSEVLILDDIGTEKITRNNIVDVIYAILKYRGDHNKPTFITSNLSKDQYYQLLNDSGLNRIDIARLKEQLDVLTKEMMVTGINRRVKAC